MGVSHIPGVHAHKLAHAHNIIVNLFALLCTQMSVIWCAGADVSGHPYSAQWRYIPGWRWMWGLTLHLYHAGLSPHLLPISHKAYLFKAEARAGGGKRNEEGGWVRRGWRGESRVRVFGLIQLLAPPPWENIPPWVSSGEYVCMCMHVFVLQRRTLFQAWSVFMHVCVCSYWQRRVTHMLADHKKVSDGFPPYANLPFH